MAQQHRHDEVNRYMKGITVLIPTYNRARALESVWPSYTSQRMVERIIVVNDGSTDGTDDLVRELSVDSPVPVQIVSHSSRLGQQASRIDAIAEAETEWVLFGEDDVWLSDDYCATLYRTAIELGADAVGGRLVTLRVPNDFSPELIERREPAGRDTGSVFDLQMLGADFSAAPAGPLPAPYLHSIALLRRSLFTRVSFDTWFRGNGWREETDFYLAANSLGYVVYFTPDTACFHLRGPLTATGGQRINRLAVEYYNIRNSHYMVAKHWPYLEKQLDFRGTPLTWTIRYAWRRELRQVRRILKSGFRSSFQG